ncbi:MAG: hypothetical protein U9O94_07180, partial [Nanoarchaeota archaeon]|nr:hypothetical protein [Nanoarchaeota archaeon]
MRKRGLFGVLSFVFLFLISISVMGVDCANPSSLIPSSNFCGVTDDDISDGASTSGINGDGKDDYCVKSYRCGSLHHSGSRQTLGRSVSVNPSYWYPSDCGVVDDTTYLVGIKQIYVDNPSFYKISILMYIDDVGEIFINGHNVGRSGRWIDINNRIQAGWNTFAFWASDVCSGRRYVSPYYSVQLICYGTDSDRDEYSTSSSDIGRRCCVGKTERCLGADCDDSVASCTTDCTSMVYLDIDRDGFGETQHRACDAPVNYDATQGGDCDDGDDNIGRATDGTCDEDNDEHIDSTAGGDDCDDNFYCLSNNCVADLDGDGIICAAFETSCNYDDTERINGFSVCYNDNSYICIGGGWQSESCQNACDYYKDVNTCLPSGLCEGCLSSCTSDDDCDLNGHCNGECVADLGAGSDCIDDSDCESNSCRDDYDGGRFCAVDSSSCVHDPPGYAPASYPFEAISDDGNFYCNDQGVWEDIDLSSTACSGLEMSWLAGGIGINAKCCGDDLITDDFEQDTVGGGACIDGVEVPDGSAVDSFLVSDGQIYSCNSQSTYTFDTDHFDVTCTAVDGKYCNDDNNWKTTKSGACGCGTGSECSTGLCINGACRSSCEGYTQSVSKCSDDEIPYTSEESGVCVHNNSVYYCDTNEVADVDASQALELVDDCAIGDYRDQCDGDYQGDFDVDGVCGNTNNEICIDNWAGASQQTDGSIPTFGGVGSTEYDICFGNGGDYCDYVGDGGWTPLDRRCDESDEKCRSCDLETGMDSEGFCEKDCGAPYVTDEQVPDKCYQENSGYISSDCIYYDDPDSNKETCECMEDIGYWDMGGEVA